jgi:hypothetical protein
LKAWAPWHGQDGDFFEEETPSGITRLYHNVQPFGQGRRHGQPINQYPMASLGMGLVKVPEA